MLFSFVDELDPELWCDERNTGEYPSSLAAPLPPGATLPPAPPPANPTAGVSKLVGTPALMILMLLSVLVVVLL